MSGQTDTIVWKLQLEGVSVTGHRHRFDVKPLPQIYQTYVLTGKKSESISVAALAANLTEKTGRQLFARIPGVFIYDMDGSGNQVNMATRGLDPHRSWELNVRQNGVILNSDLYGYPASHYSMPMEAIQRIELVRGTASLQYGAEFGGMLNYVLKSPDTSRALVVESINTVGAFGLLSTFQSVGGKIGKVSYYGYYQRRKSDGYRKNSRSDAAALYAGISYTLSDKLKLDVSIGRSQYLYQIPGPLTDSLFNADPRLSTRNRNYYSPDIWVPSIQVEWALSQATKMHVTASGIFGDRSSVQFEGFANQSDKIQAATGQYAGRWVDIDRFDSRTAEVRLLHTYSFLGKQAVLATGMRYFNNRLQRQQRGQGTNGSDYDLTVKGAFGRDLLFLSESIAAYMEQMVQLSQKFSISAGCRYEYGNSRMRGTINYLDADAVPQEIHHRIPSLGLSGQYQVGQGTKIYAGISQAYRPVVFKDIIPGSVLEAVGKDLKNATGYNAEVGISGHFGQLMRYDVTLFAMLYNNRMGNQIRQGIDGELLIYKTNIGNSFTRGVEWYMEMYPYQDEDMTLSFFTAASRMSARYRKAMLFNGKENIDISGNQVESVPEWIVRLGPSFHFKGTQINVQYSYTSATFSDPYNTVNPSANGAVGLVPAYGIWDVNLAFKLHSSCQLRGGITNLFNTSYFTKRPLFYPGPGVWSSDGRGFYITFSIKV